MWIFSWLRFFSEFMFSKAVYLFQRFTSFFFAAVSFTLEQIADSISYISMMNGFEITGDWQQALQLLQHVQHQKLEADCFSFKFWFGRWCLIMVLLLEAMGKDVFTVIYTYMFSWYSANRVIEKFQTPREGCIYRGWMICWFSSTEWFLKMQRACLRLPGGEGGQLTVSGRKKHLVELKNFSLFLLSSFPGNILRFLLKRDELEFMRDFSRGLETMDGWNTRWIRCYSALPSMLVKMHSNGHWPWGSYKAVVSLDAALGGGETPRNPRNPRTGSLG